MKPVTPANIDWRIWRPVMRNPQLATIRDLEGYQPRVDGEPPMAITSLNRLSDMHEAMDIEDEMSRRAEEAARKKAQQGRRK